MSKKTFEEFTNRYELSKTLRFELKPIGKTQEMLEDNQVFKEDELIQKKYQETKKYFDRLHREFAKESLRNAKLSDLEKYNEALKNVKKITRETSSKDKKILETILENEEKRLRKEVVTLFNAKAKEWSEKYVGLKNKDLKILDEKDVFTAILKEKYGKEEKSFLRDDRIKEFILNEEGEKISIFDEWNNFTGYFTKFFETRKNFYKDDGTSTALATRIIDQNLRRFVENISTIEFIQKNYSDFSFSEVVQKYGFDVETVCDLNFYASHCILQEGINKYNKDFVGKIKYAINHYRQRPENKGKRVPYLKTLDKQILSEKDKFIEEIEVLNPEEGKTDLKTELEKLSETGKSKTKILQNLFAQFVNDQEKFNLTKIYFSKKGFEQISRRWTSETQKWEEKLAEIFKQNKKNLTKKKDEGYSFPDFISLDFFKQSLNLLSQEEKENFWKERYKIKTENTWDQFLEIFQLEFDELFKKTIQTNKGEKIVGYDVFADNLSRILKNERIEKNKELKIVVKEFADSLLSIYQFSKYFAVEKSKKWDDSIKTDDEFYNNLEYGFFDKYYKDSFEEIITPYNLLRNYLTKKPWESVQKWKLNFEKSNLLGGWPDSPEGNTQYGSFIFRKGNEYFLGVTDFSKLFDKDRFPFAYVENSDYEKMIYKQVDAKTLYGSVYRGLFGSKYSEDQDVINDKELLQRIKKVLETRVIFFPEFKTFINKIDKNQYEDAKSLAREISEGSFYNVSFVPVSEEYVTQGKYNVIKNKKGDTAKKLLYLFQIKNKDWNEGATGAKNLHTLYFENLFSDENEVKNFILKLNGQAEIFYRPKVSAEQLGYKKDKQGKKVINHKRYNEDKIFFHVPITLNRGGEKPFSAKFNKKLNEFLANNSDINIIGVDRGEKHLAYYSVINQNQEILESGTLNTVKGGNGKEVDYHQKLEEKAKDREQARKDWQDIQGIKDLKSGYISQVVRKLADLAIKHNAIIVFEDLNMRFKQIRGGIEKSVYQQLEKALIEKLNFLVDKGEKDPKQAGNLLHAYQLTAPFTTFKEMGKQTGILFYTTASYTSKIDPATGWRPNLYLKRGSAEVNKKTILKFSKIEFVNERFEIAYDLKKFIDGKKAKFPKKLQWTVCSSVERFRWNRKLNNNKGEYDHYKNLTDEFKRLFERVGIDISKNILEQIKELETKGNEKFFSDFIFLFSLVCQIRNTNEKAKTLDQQDFILSPVEPFFDSRKDNGKNLPKNGDDNGAFNIARKGVITLEKINEWVIENEKLIKKGEKEKYSPDLYISNQDWDDFVIRN